MEFTDYEMTQIIPKDDHSHKIRMLKNLADDIQSQDERFYTLVKSAIEGEGQKGKIAGQMGVATMLRKQKEQDLYLALKIIQVVGNFSEQVESNKQQKIVIRYKESAKIK
ncbi:hypothetical protein SAMN05421663_104182 [Terribacillus halophilus]|uniref:Uncharacterized protein n=1 Tax=Terribacillus halophilus TaxID=361279 RepID=A0A1G6PP57_9BACI|nr:hypothetical protein [Terribacillus halophilus]SDC81177.1 hypothetical protein SAMN05421663_104182 [Terribacillus halophilus]